MIDHLLWGDVESLCAHVDLLVDVHARDDEEDTYKYIHQRLYIMMIYQDLVD